MTTTLHFNDSKLEALPVTFVAFLRDFFKEFMKQSRDGDLAIRILDIVDLQTPAQVTQ